MNYFDYNDGSDVIPSDAFRISPSQLSKFFDFTSQWYREQVLKESPAFESSTASELGNCVHAAAAMYDDNGSYDTQAISDYINSISNPEVDKSIINEQWQIMADTLISDFCSKNHQSTHEEFISYEVSPGIFAAGSLDRYSSTRLGGVISDYKTMSSLDKARLPSAFSRSYWFQQALYAWILRKNNRPVNYLELVYVTRNNTGRFNDKGKALKDYPSQTHIVRIPVDDQMMEIIDNTMKLISESIQLWNSNPEYRHLLMQDMRYKEKPAPQLFKD